MLAWIAAALASSIPQRDAAFCATVHQFMIFNGTTQNSQTYGLCLDPDNLKWSRKMQEPQVLQQYFNGTDRFTVNSTGACLRKYFGKPRFGKQMMPWHMVLINPNATLNRTVHNFDGYPSVYVYADVVLEGHRKLDLEWYVGRRAPGPPDQFLRSVAIQPWGVTRKLMHGIRDFSKDYVAPPPAGSFTPRSGIKCDWEGPVFRPADTCGKCPAHSRCCVDPTSGSPVGACFAVDMCEHLPGTSGKSETAFDESDPLLDFHM